MTQTVFIGIVGAVISVLFFWVPKLNTWYAALEETKKRLTMLGTLAVVTGAIYGISCTGWWSLVSCDKEGLKTLIEIFVTTIVGNQTAFLLSPKPEAVKAVLLEKRVDELIESQEA